MGTETPYFYRVTNCRKVKMADEKPRGRPGKGPKGTGESGYNRFVKQNMALALAEKRKKVMVRTTSKFSAPGGRIFHPRSGRNSTKKKTSSTPFPSKGPRVGPGMAPSMEKRLDIFIVPFFENFVHCL